MTLLDSLTTIFRDVFDDDSITLSPEMTADDIEGWDSFVHLNLLLSIESFFEIEITDEESPQLRNIGDLIKIIENKSI